MEFSNKYTTAEKIVADKTEKEKEKISLSNDAFSIGEMLNELTKKIEALRLSGFK